MAAGTIYMQCEEPEFKDNMLDRTSRKSGGFLLQSCRYCSERTSISILYVANLVLFLLWIITTIIITGKDSRTTKELEQLHGNQTLLSAKDTLMEKKLEILHSNQSSYASQMNNSLQKLNDSQTKQIEHVTISVHASLSDEKEKIWDELFKLASVLHKLNASACKMCPEGWLMNRGHCYYFHKESMYWSLAQKFCEDQGGYLVSINDYSEQVFLDSLKKPYRNWIGLNDMKSEGNFVWVDGTHLTYSHWSDYPDDYGTGEDCVEMIPNGYWNDYGCGNKVEGCICEMSWNCQ